ncbi:MAG: hypothetical protein U1E31_02185 [Rickettsiales bacterium]
MKKLTNLEQDILMNAVLINSDYTKGDETLEADFYEMLHMFEAEKFVNNNFFIYLNGLNKSDKLYNSAKDEETFIKKYSKGIHITTLHEFMSNKNEQINIPDNSNIAVIIESHGSKNKDNGMLIPDDLDKFRKPQDVIKKIRETLEYNIKDKKEPRDINIRFHSCYAFLITQNKEAMKELENLSKVLPNSRVNLITEKFGAVTYDKLVSLNQQGIVHPTKVFLNGKTHPRTFLTQEEIQKSKEHLIELLETLYKNEIKPGFTIHDFMLKNKNNQNVLRYQNEPKKAYNEYREDFIDKIEGHLIHLGKNKEFIKELNDIQIPNRKISFLEEIIRFFKSETIKIYNIDKLIDYINDYKFEVEKEPYILESKAFMEKLEEHQKKIDNPSLSNNKSLSSNESMDSISDSKFTKYESMDSISEFKSTKYESMDSISESQSTLRGQNKNSNNVTDTIDKQDPKKINSNIKSDIRSRSNSVPRSSFVEKLKDPRERSNSHSNRNR